MSREYLPIAKWYLSGIDPWSTRTEAAWIPRAGCSATATPIAGRPRKSLAAMLDNQQSAFVAVRNALPALARRHRPPRAGSATAGRLIYVGAGASGRLAVQDGVELLPDLRLAERASGLFAGGR